MVVYETNFTKDIELKIGSATVKLECLYHSRAARFLTAPAKDEFGLWNVKISTNEGSTTLSGRYVYVKKKMGSGNSKENVFHLHLHYLKDLVLQ